MAADWGYGSGNRLRVVRAGTQRRGAHLTGCLGRDGLVGGQGHLNFRRRLDPCIELVNEALVIRKVLHQ